MVFAGETVSLARDNIFGKLLSPAFQIRAQLCAKHTALLMEKYTSTSTKVDVANRLQQVESEIRKKKNLQCFHVTFRHLLHHCTFKYQSLLIFSTFSQFSPVHRGSKVQVEYIRFFFCIFL